MTWMAAVTLTACVVHAETLYERDGITLEGTAVLVTREAGICQVLEERHSPEVYERMKVNHGQPLHVWRLDFAVRNGSGSKLEQVTAYLSIASEAPPCTSWSGLLGNYAKPVQSANSFQLLKKPDGMAPGEELSDAVFLLAFRDQQPRFESWKVDYRFAVGLEDTPADAASNDRSAEGNGKAQLTADRLPPEVMADRYLLKAEQAVREQDFAIARLAMGRLQALQDQYELDLPDEYYFRYARTAAVSQLPEQAHKAVVRYLSMTGREGQHYAEALELLIQAEEVMQARHEPQAAPPERSSRVQTTGKDPVETAVGADMTAGGPDEQEVPPRSACDLPTWNTEDFFQTATVKEVNACLKAGADVAASTEDGHTPLHQAAQFNENPAIVQALLARGADLSARVATGDEHTPLHEAAANNENPAVLQALLAAGADPMIRDGRGASLLRWAAMNENPAVIELLLGTEIDPNVSDEDGYTPLHWATRNNGNPAVIESLLTAGADPMARAKDGRTPLHSAALGNQGLAVFQVLLEAGADVEARTEKDHTPLHWAVANNDNPAVIKLLLKSGADLEAGRDDGWKPLHWAAHYNENPGGDRGLAGRWGCGQCAGRRWQSPPPSRG